MKEIQADRVRRWEHDPILFGEEMWPGVDLREFQRDMLRAIAEQKAVVCKAPRGAGKTEAMLKATFWFLLTRQDGLVVWIAPAAAQANYARDLALSLWMKSDLRNLFPEVEFLAMEVRVPSPTGGIRFVTAQTELHQLPGLHSANVMVIYDEGRGTADDVFDIGQGLIPLPGDKLIAASTPGAPSGWFYEAFGRDRAFWGAHISVTADDLPHLREKAASERQRLSEYNSIYLNEWRAEFSSATISPFFDFDKVQAAIGRELDESVMTSYDGQRVVGCDVARFGRDLSVAVVRHGRRVVHIDSWGRCDLAETQRRILTIVQRHTATFFVCDSVGVGAGLMDFTRQEFERRGWTTTAVDFNGGSRPTDSDSYAANLKTQVAMSVRELMEKGLISIPNHPQLVGELLAEEVIQQANGKFRVKDPTNKSPDFLDALLLAFAPADEINPMSVAAISNTLAMRWVTGNWPATWEDEHPAAADPGFWR